ncbi:MAG TPA: fluoride efflux transporter CrcB [Mucilaginibacter sp.]|jgi:CrcB protein|nr:fluoride efflux transporter CrcB [Mucilaginibacter sp.]
MQAVLLIFVGGGIGSLLRYGLSRLVNNNVISHFPFGTFIVNIIGCFFIGFFIFYTERYQDTVQEWRLFLVTGLCGGFTTFSAFSMENVQLMTDGRIGVAFLYIIASVALGLLATYGGLLAGKSI